MNKSILLILAAMALVACQSVSLPQAQPTLRRQAVTGHSSSLPLSRSLLQILARPDEEEPSTDGAYSDSVAKSVFDPDYIHAHSYYFDYLSQGHSSIEIILAHDGHARAATLVQRWRKVLAEGAMWPDKHSTTYRGPFPALEHGEIDGADNGWFLFRSASNKSEEYFQRAVSAWKPGLAPDDPGQSEAWAWLGRSSHLIQDLSVPFHTRPLVRPSQALFHNAYENSCANRFADYMPGQNANPYGVWSEGPYPATGSWGLYYPPGTGAGAIVSDVARQARPFYSLVNERENPGSGNWEMSRAVMVPLGAKSTSGLVMAFLQKVGVNN